MTREGRSQRGLGSIEERNGKWWLRVSVTNEAGARRQKRFGPFATEADAVEKRQALAPLGTDKSMTVGEWLDRYIVTRRSLLIPGGRTARFAELEQHTRVWLKPLLGDFMLVELRAEDCDKAWAKILDAGRTHKTVVNVRSTLVHAIKSAQKSRKVPDNAASLSEIPKKHQAATSKSEAVAERVLHGDDLARVEDWALSSIEIDTWAMPCLLALDTGARRGEVVGLRWSDLDWNTGKIRIRQQVTTEKIDGRKRPILGDVKTQESKRTIQLPQRTLAALRRHRDAHPPTVSDLIFHRNGGEIRNPDVWTNWVERTLRKKVDVADLCPHDFRHTHASHLLAAGVNVVEVSRRIGHKWTSTTLDTYGHAIPEEDSDTADVWERIRTKKASP